MKTNTYLLTGLGFSQVGATCYALPITLAALGVGSAVASMVLVMPWLTTLSEYKAVTFSITAIILAYSFWRLHHASYCELAGQARVEWQRVSLWIGTTIFIVSVFAAYALLPLTLLFQG